jgi:uncharacterized protein
MKITGTYTIRAPREQVWTALQDPATLARCLPGCQQLQVTGDGEYAATVWAGVASIRGAYQGTVRLSDQEAPESYRLHASGSGGPGTIEADARISLAEDTDGHTVLDYEADAMVGGPIAGVGQRVLAAAAKKNAADFFTAVEQHLAGEPVPAPTPAAVAARPAEAAPTAAPPQEAVPTAAPAQVGQVFPGTPPPPPPDTKTLLGAALAGAVIALLGVWLGRRTAR